MYRRKREGVEVFLVHPGGPYWAKKDLGAWSIPKGAYCDDEEPLVAARREFLEETGFVLEGEFIALGDVRQAGGKRVAAWAVEGDCDPAQLVSNTFSLEWPPRSGRFLHVPEVDRGEWFSISAARERILKAQVVFLDVLIEKLQAL